MHPSSRSEFAYLPSTQSETPVLRSRACGDERVNFWRNRQIWSLVATPTIRVVQSPGNTGEIRLPKVTKRSVYKYLARGGGSGIRTRDTVSRIHTFQACAFNHSATPPCRHEAHAPRGGVPARRPSCRPRLSGTGQEPWGLAARRGRAHYSRRPAERKAFTAGRARLFSRPLTGPVPSPMRWSEGRSRSPSRWARHGCTAVRRCCACSFALPASCALPSRLRR